MECSPAEIIEGTVTDASGQPVGGATVNALGSGSNGVATSRGDGAFGIAGLEELPHIVVVHPGFVRARQDDITPDARPAIQAAAQAAAARDRGGREKQRARGALQRRPAVNGPAMPGLRPRRGVQPRGYPGGAGGYRGPESSVTLQVVSEGYMTHEEPVRFDSSAPEQEFRVALARRNSRCTASCAIPAALLPGAAIHLDALPRNLAMTVVGGPGSPVGGAVPPRCPGRNPPLWPMPRAALNSASRTVSRARSSPRWTAMRPTPRPAPRRPLVLELPSGRRGGMCSRAANRSWARARPRLTASRDPSQRRLQWTLRRPATLEVTSRAPDAPVQTVGSTQAGQVTEVTVTFP